MLTKAVDNIYLKRNEFILIGLTGRTGSGCTTLAKILKTEDFDDLTLKEPKSYNFANDEERKYQILHQFMKTSNHWQAFSIIEVSSIILSFVLQQPLENLSNFIDKLQTNNDEYELYIAKRTELNQELHRLAYMFNESKSFTQSEYDDSKNEDFYDYFVNKVTKYKNQIKKFFRKYHCVEHNRPRLSDSYDTEYDLYTYLMQLFGNNIRASGNPYSEKFTSDSQYCLTRRIDFVINIIKKHNELKGNKSTRICIDAIRNPFEARYFHDTYRSFYLFSVNVDDKERRNRLKDLKDKQIDSLDRIEYPEKFSSPEEIFYHQDIQSCLDITDIHLYNGNNENEKFYDLTEQLIRYIALILHPGLITPTKIERCMQLAYTCKLNSGCLSRQVGAVITDENFSIKAVGWNDVPSGQVPCNLRDVCSYKINADKESFSDFELHDNKFKVSIEKISSIMSKCDQKICGLPKPFCFKDIYNSIGGSNNQVHTRSLHAEENAFLQLAKYGGQGILGGNLFTTSSPCELCAKKAYHLGIKHIYYIDPYPGISRKHILKFGTKFNPEQHLYFGAIGNAYVSLYDQRMPIKDELSLMSGINMKKLVNRNPEPITPQEINEIRFKKISLCFEFIDRENIVVTNNYHLVALVDSVSHLERELYWSGSSMEKPILIKNENSNCTLIIKDHSAKSQCYYTIQLKNPISKGESLQYTTQVTAKDEYHEMQPYFSYNVRNYIEQLEISVKIHDKELIDNVSFEIYADKARRYKASLENSYEKIEPKQQTGSKSFIYTKIIPNPKLYTNYCIEWKFKKP